MENKNVFKTGSLLTISLLVILFMIPAGAFTQTAANFSGIWAFNESKSNLGEGQFRMASQKLVITQEANTFSIERAFTNPNGEEMKISEKYTLDGKVSKNPVFNSEKKSTATWSADKKALTVSSVVVFEMSGEKNEIKTVEVYTLGDAGKTLTINSTSTSSRGERKNTLVYDKK